VGNLPAETSSFIGRRREVAEIRKRLTEARLVSLVGPGGVGKTRLAIRLATQLGRSFVDGAWLVELAEVRRPAAVGDAVIAALDLRDQSAVEPLALVRSYLRDKKLLLVVDNCEHLREAVARLVTSVMKAASDVRIIVTSREPLTVAGEQLVPVPPLELPPPDATGHVTGLWHNEAIRLFTERAAAANGKFELTVANRWAVVNLCRRLDGLPLAIELAAVRTRVLTVEQILRRLTDRFGLLTGGDLAALPRHQTLRAAIDWSYDLLGVGEQALLRRLSVFVGRFTLEDIESVCTDDDVPTGRALDLLSSLVDKSLVLLEDSRGFACYRLHETMREYSRIKLQEAGEEESNAQRFVEYYSSRCRRSAASGRFRLPEWLDWMDLEIDNVRFVLQWCLTRKDFRHGTALASAMGWYWMTRGTGEGVRWFDALLAIGGSDPKAQARGHFMRGFLAVLQADPDTARPALEQAVASAQEAGQRSVLAQSLSLAAIAAGMAGDRTSARRLAGDARDTTTAADDLPASLMFLQSRALNGLLEGDLEAAREAASEGARLSREVGDLHSLGMMLLNAGSAALIAGDLDESKPMLAEALRIAYQIDDRVGQYCLLDALGYHAASSGQARLAARLLGAAETVRTTAGASILPFLVPLVTRAEEGAKEALGIPRFASEFQAGLRLNRHIAVGMALSEGRTITAAAADQGSFAPLGRRQAEVARLVAEGLSNKQIGARLFISEYTVDSHVRTILNKLGFASRTEIASWIASLDREY
jgi:predicted ATPase/DNA-binding CsgD family transcriptional regulator